MRHLFKQHIISLVLVLAMAEALLPSAMAVGGYQFSIVEMRQSGDDITMYLTRFSSDWTVDTRTYSAGQYIVSMDGETHTAESAVNLRQSGGKIHYILLVDISGSIHRSAEKGNISEADAINAALKRFYGNLDANEYVTVIPFGNSGANVVAREQQKAALASLPELSFRDNYTHMFEAIVTGANIYADNPEKYARTAMIMITDGTDDYTNSNASMENADHWTYAQAKEKMLAANVPFYALMFSRDKGNQDQVNALAASTNGATAVVDTAHIGERFTNLQSITRNSSVLTLKLEQEAEAPMTQVIPTRFIVSVDAANSPKTPERLFDVDWSKVTAMKEPLDLFLERFQVGTITEDDNEILVNTEPGATVTFSMNSRQLASVVADSRGMALWRFEQRFQPDQEIVVYARDAKGNDKFEDEKSKNHQENPCTVKVGKSPRAPITVTLAKELVESGYEYFGDPLIMTVNGEPGQRVEITWAADDVEQKVFEKTLQNNGALSLRLDFAEMNGIDKNDIYGGNIIARYTDGLGVSCAGASEGSLTWHREKPAEADTSIEQPLPVASLTADSSTWTLQTEPGAVVRVLWDETHADEKTADASGMVTFDVPERMREEQEVTVTAIDTAGNHSLPLSYRIGRSIRDEISIDQMREALFDNKLPVRGHAMAGQTVAITWTPLSDSSQQITHTVTANEQGIFSDVFTMDECALGEGSITVAYADGRAYEKLVRVNAVAWASPTPEPSATPTPIPATPTPAPIVTASTETEAAPEATAEPEGSGSIVAQLQGLLHGDTAALRNPLVWVILGAIFLLIILIVVLIVLSRKRRSSGNDQIESVNLQSNPEIQAYRSSPTIRRSEVPKGNVQDTNATRPMQVDRREPHQTAKMNEPDRQRGTANMDAGPRAIISTGTVRLGTEKAPSPSGTGTVRLGSEDNLKLTFEITHGDSDEKIRRVVPIRNKLVVGRIAPADLVIDDNAVSGKHLLIERENQQVFVSDSSSSNGTLLNGQRLTSRQPLKDGDQLIIGRSMIIVHINY